MLLVFMLVIYLGSFLYTVWGNVLMSLFYMWLFSFPKITCWRDCLFFMVYSCLLCCKLIDGRCVGLILGSLFFSIDPYVCFCSITKLLQWLYGVSKVWRLCLQLYSFFQDCFDCSGILYICLLPHNCFCMTNSKWFL